MNQDPCDWPRLFQASVDQAYNVVVITDARLDPPGPEILYVNPAFEHMTGYSQDEVIGLNPRFLQGPATDRSVLERLRRNLEHGESFEGHAINYRKDGTPFHLEWSIAPVRNDEGTITHFVAVERDITRRVELEAELERQASTDPLTGLYNRIRFSEHLATEIKRLRRYGGEGTLLMLDVDNFKAVNDEHGHGIGDVVLKELCQVLDDSTREADILARWGGEELVMLAPETFLQEGELVAEKLHRNLVNHPYPTVGSLTVSIGATSVTPGDGPDDVLRRADEALYAAKEAGRNRVVVG